MPSKEDLKRQAAEVIDSKADELTALAKTILKNPESGFREVKTAGLVARKFGELGLQRIWTEIYDTDAAKQALLPKLGFTLEGRFRSTHWAEGAWHDSLFYAILRDERQGGALLYFGLGRPLAITGAAREYPSPMKFLLEADDVCAGRPRTILPRPCRPRGAARPRVGRARRFESRNVPRVVASKSR